MTRKTQYALRAVFELCKRDGQGPVKIAVIAKVQAIPARFLEVILSQLKQAGFVNSKRGNGGGYFMARSPGELTVGDVVRFVQGPVRTVGCSSDKPEQHCVLYGQCVFLPMWNQVEKAISDIYDRTTFQDLVEAERKRIDSQVLHYSI
ncbi:MAG: RrF2 family transcriptional regulator [Planctomycetota bacterium]